MSDEREDALGPDESAALAGLPRERRPPPDLEEKVVRELARRGFLGSRSRGWPGALRVAGALAASLLLFAGGLFIGRREPIRSAAPDTGRYLLLLSQGPAFKVPAGGNLELVREYRRWALGLRGAGRIEGGEELGRGGWLLTGDGRVLDLAAGAAPGGGTAERIGGYFVIKAEDEAQALRIAGTCPHLRHGGRIELRRIQPT